MIPIIIILLLFHYAQITSQSSYNVCPKTCTCDNLELFCNRSYAASGLPHTLNTQTIRITINNADTSQFLGLDYLASLEQLNLANNKISSIDFAEINKNQNLKYLNTSHNQIINLKDSALSEIDFTSSIDTRTLKQLNKISLIELIIDHNQLTTIKDYTFIRCQKLQKLDLSYNQLTTLTANSLFGLSKLEVLTLRSNRLVQVPTLALVGTTLPYNLKLSPLKVLDISENPMVSLDSDSFSILVGLLQRPLLMNLSCTIPPSLKGKSFLLNLPDNRLECLEPESQLNLHIGFATLFFITFIVTFVCLINFCKNKKHLFVKLKKNLVQNHISSIVLPYSQNIHKNVNDLKKETQLYDSEYEQIDYNCPGQLFTLGGGGVDQPFNYGGQQPMQSTTNNIHTLHL